MLVLLLLCCYNCSDELEFYQECIADDEKLYDIINNYRCHRKNVMGSGGTPDSKKWQAAALKNSMYKENATDVLGMGSLMNKRRFCQWASDRFFLTPW